MSSKTPGSITGLGIRNKAGGLVGKKDSAPSSSTSKPSGSITGLGIRNKAGGMIGRGKGGGSTDAENHVSRPLSTLKDPASFGPPPKNVNYHGESAYQVTPDNRGLGAPFSRDEIHARRRADEEEAQREEDEAARAPRTQWKIDTTGLSTDHLPPPPGRRDGADGRMAILPPPTSATKTKPPGLPPRLPPRTNSMPLTPPIETDTHKGILNQGALNRLGNAGVNVPGLGIERRRQPLPSPTPSSPSRSPAPNHSPQLSELQSRFSKMSTSGSPHNESPAPQETTWAQKQAALKTASSFRDDPSSVSLSDAKAAASTANNFRARHGEQVKSGWQSANKLNTKYGISEKVGAYGGTVTPESGGGVIEMRDNTDVAQKKRPPPPPPAKKASLTATGISKGPAPPPIPLSTKPPARVSSHNS